MFEHLNLLSLCSPACFVYFSVYWSKLIPETFIGALPGQLCPMAACILQRHRGWRTWVARFFHQLYNLKREREGKREREIYIYNYIYKAWSAVPYKTAWYLIENTFVQSMKMNLDGVKAVELGEFMVQQTAPKIWEILFPSFQVLCIIPV